MGKAMAATNELVTQWQARTLAMETRMTKTLKRLKRAADPTIQRTNQRRRAQTLELTLDNTLEECRRLAFLHVTELFDADGNLKPMSEWPRSQIQAALQLLGLKRQALTDVLEYLRHAGVYGQPEPPPPSGNNLTVNNMTIVPIEQLTDEELEFYRGMLEKGRAIPLDVPATPKKVAGG